MCHMYCRFWIADLEKNREMQQAGGSSITRHVAAPSLGHYASLSFVVRGRGQKIEERDSPVGAAFKPRFEQLLRFLRFQVFTAYSSLAEM